MKIHTIGFTRKSAQQFFELLLSSDASVLVDTRLNNSSQLARFSVATDLAWFISKLDGFRNWEYIQMPELAPTSEMLKSYREASKKKSERDAAWQSYTEQYLGLLKDRDAVQSIDQRILTKGIVLLCSEHEADRCHRRLVAEEIKRLLHPDCEIVHL